MHHILIDHENVQPADLAGLDAHEACVWVFTGAQQKVAISLIEAIQALGERGRFVRISGNSRNALDFHIAYYLGGFVARDSLASFLIVSADAGYDPLITHLNAQGIVARRVPLPQAAAPPKKPKSAQSSGSQAVSHPSPKPNGATTEKKGKKLTFIVDPPASKAPPATSNKAAASPMPPQSGVNDKKPPQAAQSDADTVIRRLRDMPKNLPRSEASLRRMVGTWLSKDAKRLDAVLSVLRKRSVIVANGTKLGYQLPKA